MAVKEGRKPNRLIPEKPSYLLQHAYNPVDWYPWGEEAFLRKQNKRTNPFSSALGIAPAIGVTFVNYTNECVSS